MPLNSSERIQHLHQKLKAAQDAITISSENTALQDKLSEFEEAFAALSSLSYSNQIQEIACLKKYNFNRGDIYQMRTWPLNLEDYKEDHISRLSKILLETIEDENLSPELINAYHQNGVYKILYHNGIIAKYHPDDSYFKGYEFEGPIGPELLKSPTFYLGLAALSVALFATATFLGLSGGWMIVPTALFSAATAYISGLLYGVVNDIFATKANLPYFLLGHQEPQYSLFYSNDQMVQAIGWGIIATHPFAIIASLIFGISTAISMAASASPILTFVLPILLLSTVFFAFCVDIFARYMANVYQEKGYSLSILPEDFKNELRTVLKLEPTASRVDLDKIDFDSPELRKFLENKELLNDYQFDGLSLMSSSKKDKANWLANDGRNLLGYIGMPILGITGLVLMLSLKHVPMMFFTPLYSSIIPLAVSGIVLAALASALAYVSINKEKQIDNRFKLRCMYSRGIQADELFVELSDLKAEI